MPHLPREPSEKEKQEHEASGHAVFRSWCVHCVFGKGRDHPHVEAAPGELPEVGVDYGYMGREHGKAMPHIVAKCRRSQMLASTAIEKKGRQDDYAASFVVAFILSLGWKRLVMRSDNEPAMLSLLSRVAANLPGV